MVNGDAMAAIAARPILLSVEVSFGSGSSVMAEVQLQVADRLCRGVAARPEHEVEYAVAAATLRAIEQAKPVRVRAVETMYVRSGDHEVGVVVVDMAGMRRPLTGSALLDEKPMFGFARAALDAVNRIVTDQRLLSEAVRNTAFGLA
jgi:hypothetical protein